MMGWPPKPRAHQPHAETGTDTATLTVPGDLPQLCATVTQQQPRKQAASGDGRVDAAGDEKRHSSTRQVRTTAVSGGGAEHRLSSSTPQEQTHSSNRGCSPENTSEPRITCWFCLY